MNYYELISTVYLKKDIYYREANEIIAKHINKAMYIDNELSKYHVENRYKLYVFNIFYPTEADKQYKAGKIYVYNIRTIDKDFAEKISKLLKQTDSDYFKVIAVEKKAVKQHTIEYLQTITPMIITTEGNKNWVPGDNLDLLQKRLSDNLEKKYNSFYQEKPVLKDNLIERIEILNKVPISLKYKNTNLLGNKIKIYVKPEEEYQKLAFVAEAVGLGEKNSSIGAGFCIAQYLK